VSGAEIDEERNGEGEGRDSASLATEAGEPTEATESEEGSTEATETTGSTEDSEGGTGGAEPEGKPTRAYRKPAFAVARALVVLAIAGVGFAIVIPLHHDRQTRVVDTRMAQLTIPETGVAGFKATPSSAGVQSLANVGLAVVTNAAKRDPGHTGLYTKDWPSSAKGSTDSIGLVVFLMPTSGEAQSLLTQVNKMELAASAQSANSLKRTGTFTVPGLSGSAGSVFVPTKPSKTSPDDLVLSSFRQGNVVTLVQAAKAHTAASAHQTRDNVVSVSKTQAAHVEKVGPGFTLVELVRPAGTDIPTTSSIVWIAGALVVAFLAAVGPLFYGAARRRRQARLQADLDRMIVVRGQTITKRRR
jgi:hypothetical protein